MNLLARFRKPKIVPVTDEQRALADQIMGRPGRMIGTNRLMQASGVKNACVCIRGGVVWFGDLDLSSETTQAQLNRLADGLGQDVMVLRESDARWSDTPRFEKAVATFLAHAA